MLAKIYLDGLYDKDRLGIVLKGRCDAWGVVVPSVTMTDFSATQHWHLRRSDDAAKVGNCLTELNCCANYLLAACAAESARR